MKALSEPIHDRDRVYIVVALLSMAVLVVFAVNMAFTKKTTSETTKQRVATLEEWRAASEEQSK